MSNTYDDALLKQLLAKRKVDGMVDYCDIYEVFRVVAWDVFLAIEQQRPDITDEQLATYVSEEIIPRLADALEAEGWQVIRE